MTEKCVFLDAPDEAVIYRGDDGMIILDDPIRPGHVLVGINTHVPNISDADPAEVGAMMQLATKAAKIIEDTLGFEKCYVVAVGDKDKHFHVHLLPKNKEDPGMGPSIFSGAGWAGFLPEQVDNDLVAKATEALKANL